MAENKYQIAELYYRSNSVKFGAFKLSAHRENPNLPDSPWDLHYPKPTEPGAEFLPLLYKLIGAEFYEIAAEKSLYTENTRVCGLPNGATPLGDELASHYDNYPHNLIEFEKTQHPGGQTTFSRPIGIYVPGDTLLPAEDHVSGARNNKLFTTHARNCGFIVTNLLVVVDRQQGGVANMKAIGVDVNPILTGDELLQYGLAESYITEDQYQTVQTYRLANQFSLAGLVPTVE